MSRRRRIARSTAILLAVTATLTSIGGSVAFAYTHHAAAARPELADPAAPTSPTPSASLTLPASPTPPASPTAAPAPSTPPAPYRVVGLGDSVPAGSACGCTTYVTLVGQQRAQAAGRTASVTNLARPGLTTTGLATQLGQSSVRDSLAGADLIIVTIGANDFDAGLLTAADCQPATTLSCYRDTLSQQRPTLSGVLARINAIRPKGSTVLVTGYWNVFLDGRVGRTHGTTYVQGSDALTRADNTQIASVAAAQADRYVDIYTPFKGDGSRDDTGLLAADGDHPNAAGHALIARTLEHAMG